ncbi:hypothetical protein [Rubellicoccus peritrichatus]|uniref:Uncharacterized protein n=1 Tax=Rubellicoccus peritrichatus TaxID=3080537 RepID=A0AAQ3QWD3_9BACT|nr:hypothetical protein [Puniceicoccus sp. CR14]WOO41777.1 hypothetical protein RZN69_01655 [Puniceicoccus sp. CR14]
MTTYFSRFTTHKSVLAALVLVLTGDLLVAYPYDDTQEVLPTYYDVTGITTRENGTVHTYGIPITNWPPRIDFLIIRGGDGGRAKAIATAGKDKTASGGGGALLSAEFAVDPYDENALRPGGQIQIIIGSQGLDKTRNHTAASGGGGATAILYRAPVDGAEWEMLAVAGGGGGGAASGDILGTFANNGRNANTTEDGDNGKRTGDAEGQPGGINGGAGKTSSLPAAGGGGGYVENSKDKDGVYLIFSGGRGRAFGVRGGEGAGFGSWGGFGFASGGGGGVNDDQANPDVGKGGGGGGYSGGGAGGDDDDASGGGGGGGSYISAWAISKSATTRDSNRISGQVAFTADVDSTGDLAGPTFNLPGADNAVQIFDYQAATYDPGVTAEDLYGNLIEGDNFIGDTFDQSSGPGTYVLNYQATDQFGKTSYATLTVTVKVATKPVFTIAGDITVIEDYGTYIDDFVTSTNAPDVDGQIITSYTVTPTFTSLFTDDGQPAINKDGILTFTPADNASGSTAVTVVATDNEDDLVNGKLEKTFTLTITSVPEPPVFYTESSMVIDENTSGAIVFTAEEPFGASILV